MIFFSGSPGLAPSRCTLLGGTSSILRTFRAGPVKKPPCIMNMKCHNNMQPSCHPAVIDIALTKPTQSLEAVAKQPSSSFKHVTKLLSPNDHEAHVGLLARSVTFLFYICSVIDTSNCIPPLLYMYRGLDATFFLEQYSTLFSQIQSSPKNSDRFTSHCPG